MSYLRGEWGEWLWTAAGALLLVWVSYDVYTLVLHARGRMGPFSELLSRGIWRLARAAAFRLAKPRRHRLLNRIGPLLSPLLIGIFIMLLIVGFALIYYPRMPAEFNVDKEARGAAWIESIYLSGTTLVTVGYGDISPRTMAMRVVALAEGISGFALITLMVTYLLNVYTALEQKRVVALYFYHQAGAGADVVGLLTHYFVGGRFRRLAATLETAARDLQRLLESHIEHPMIHYFHPIEVYKSLPRMLFLSLEVATVMRACLHREAHRDTREHPAVRLLATTAHHVLDMLNEALRLREEAPEAVAAAVDEDVSRRRRWRRRFADSMLRLGEAGIETAGDEQEAWQSYCVMRGEWEPKLRRFVAFSGYDWEEISGDLDLRDAADTEPAHQ